MSWHLCILAILLFVPGFVAFELARSFGLEALSLPSAERFFVRVALSFVITSWVSLVLAQAGLFNGASFLVAAILLVAAAVYLWWRRRARGAAKQSVGRPSGATVLIVFLIVALGALSFLPAFEQTIGARDPTTYVLWGIHLARQGAIVAYDPLVAGLQPNEVDMFFGPGHLATRAHYGSRFLGFYLIDPSTGRVEAQGLPLYPTLIGHGYLADGVPGALMTTPLLAIFACIAAFYLGLRTWGTAVGTIAALWLVLAPPQVWFARYANAEILGQALVLVGLYALVQFRRNRHPVFGLMAAIALGLTWLTVAWLALLAVPLYGLLAADLARGRLGRVDWLWFWLPLSLLGLHAGLHSLFFAWAYIFDLLRVVGLTHRPGLLVLACLVASSALLGFWMWGRRGARAARAPVDSTGQRPVGARTRSTPIAVSASDGAKAVRWLIAASLVLLAVYGYWIRPARYPYWHGLSAWNLALAITAVAYFLAVVGAVLMLASPRQLSRGGIILLILVGAGLPVLINPRIYPQNMWALRRFLPVVIPLFLSVGAYGLWRLSNLLGGSAGQEADGRGQGGEARSKGVPRWRPTIAAAAGIAVAVALALGLATRATPYRQAEDYLGAQAIVDAIADSVEPDALLIFEARSGWRLLDLAPGLAYTKGFDVLSVYYEEADLASLGSFFLRQAQMGRPVYFFTQGFNYYFASPGAIPHRKWSLWLEELEEVQRRLPYQILGSRIPFASYRLEIGQRNDVVDAGLDIGSWDDIYVGEMLPPETDWRRSVRWTKGTAFVWLPGLGSDATHVELRMHSPEIPSQPGRSLRLILDDVVLGEVVLDPLSWETYSFEIPSEWRPQEGEVPRLTLSTTPFRPADEFVGSADRRQLGVRLDWVRWRTGESE